MYALERPTFYAKLLHFAIAGPGTRDATLQRILAMRADVIYELHFFKKFFFQFLNSSQKIDKLAFRQVRLWLRQLSVLPQVKFLTSSSHN